MANPKEFQKPDELLTTIEVLKEEVASLKNVIQYLPGLIYWKDSSGRYLGSNQYALEYAKEMGVIKSADISEIIGKTDRDLFNQETADRYEENDRAVITSKKPLTQEEILTLPNGQVIHQFTIKRPLYDEHGNIIGVIGNSIDISDKKKMEQDRIEAIQSKSTFLSIASHEIKGPLTNSLYIVKSTKEAVENHDQAKLESLMPLYDAQLKDSQRGIDTINFLLDFLNLDLTDESLKQPEEVPIGARMIQIIDEFESNNEKNLHFELVKDDKLPRIIFIPGAIDKIVKILVGNAVKYSKRNGKVRIHLNHNLKKSKKYITISIEDNGIGINKEALNRFFLPLFYKGKDRDRIYTAPAIKLSYIKKIVESVEGELSITSEEGVGATVNVSVPYEKSYADYQAMFIPDTFERLPIEEEPTTLRKLNFLIVEDNPVTQEILKSEVSALGHKVDAVSNAQDALKKVSKKTYQVIFLDISLPGMDGVELRDKLNPNNNELPVIIAITSHDSQSDRDYFLEKGFASVIGKPFSTEDLTNCMEGIQKYLDEIGY